MEPEKEFELSEDIEVIDGGLDPEEMIGPDFVCCWGGFSPFIW